MHNRIPRNEQPRHLLLIGCGPVAERIGILALERGDVVWGTSRRAERAGALNEKGIHGVHLDSDDVRWPRLADVDSCDVVYSIPPGEHAVDAHVAWACAHGARRILYLSATSVWGHSDGRWVADDEPAAPSTERGRARLAHEEAVRDAAARHNISFCSLRLPGIYGDHNTGLDRVLSGTWRMVDDGAMWCNRIHTDDIASAVFHLLNWDSLPESVIVADGTPYRAREFAEAVMATHGVPMPPSVSLEELPASVRDFWRTNRRCRPAWLIASGWRPRFPSYLDHVLAPPVGISLDAADARPLSARGLSMERTRPLGTALQPNATRLLLLGSGELGREVALEAMRLGVEVIACDRYANAPAMHFAHRARVFDMQNPDEVRAAIESERPHLVVPEIEAIATETLVVLEREGWNIVPSARAVRSTMDREGIRTLASEALKLRTSPYRFAESQTEFREAVSAIGLPCVVKPVMSSSGKGQSTVRTEDEIDAAWTAAMDGSRGRSARVIVEGFVPFDYEITLLTVRTRDGETHFCPPIGHEQHEGDYIASWQPHPMSPHVLAVAQAMADSVTRALGGAGLFGVEFFIRGDDVWFSEVSPRPHDTGMVTLASQRCSEFELHVRAILKLPIGPIECTPGASAVIRATESGVHPSFDGVVEAMTDPRVQVRLFGKPDARPGRRMGVVVATDTTVEGALHAARTAAEKVTVTLEPTTT
jgi:phosphoribosylglycinamide formyltransferase 2